MKANSETEFGSSWEDNIKIYFDSTFSEDAEWVQIAQVSVQWRALLNGDKILVF
jgi:hypothetical protein